MSDSSDYDINAVAIKTAISISTHLVLTVVADENLDLWRKKLRDALDRCTGCPGPARPLIAAAYEFANARPGDPLSAARARLHFEAKTYFQSSAAYAADHLERLMQDEVVH